MRKISSILSAVALAVAIATPVSAHDGWSQTNTPIIGSGEVSYVELLLGNHTNEHKSYRIDGKWSTASSKVFVTTPAGKKAEITDTLFYTGEEKDSENAGKNNSLVATFASSTPGAYIVSVEGDSIFKHGEVASRTLRSAKSFVAVSDIPTVERVQFLKGFSKQVSPDRAELIPQFNPAAAMPGQNVSVQLTLKGKRLANTDISVIRRSTSDAEVYKTDANGMITFKTGPADYYLLRAKPATDEKEAGKFDTTNYEATMTFTVQNGKASFPKAPNVQAPLVYMNGKQVQAAGLLVKGGKTYVSADFIRTLAPAFKGTGSVVLTDTAKSAGATVEYLAQVGTLQPAILIQTSK